MPWPWACGEGRGRADGGSRDGASAHGGGFPWSSLPRAPSVHLPKLRACLQPLTPWRVFSAPRWALDSGCGVFRGRPASGPSCGVSEAPLGQKQLLPLPLTDQRERWLGFCSADPQGTHTPGRGLAIIKEQRPRMKPRPISLH